jgi:spermidine/putrescine-binding protein
LLKKKKLKERMKNLKELAELLLPQGILDYFDYKSYETEDEEIIITLVEKNTVPKLPEQYKSRKIRQKGFKQKKTKVYPIPWTTFTLI